MLLFLGLHNSGLGLSWLLDRSPMTVFRALRRLMLKLKAGRVEFRGTVHIKSQRSLPINLHTHKEKGKRKKLWVSLIPFTA